MSGSRGARTSRWATEATKGNFKVVFGMIVFFVPLGLALSAAPRAPRRVCAEGARRVTAAVGLTAAPQTAAVRRDAPQRPL